MIKLFFNVECENTEAEIAWLRNQKIFPAVVNSFDLKTLKGIKCFGVIVATEAALAIKLRHNIIRQEEYKQK